MKKVYELNLDLLMEDFPSSKYDIGGRGHYIIVEPENKNETIKELTQWFNNKLKENFYAQFVCESCGESHDNESSLMHCPECNEKMCEYCETTLDICENCFDKRLKN